MSEPVVFSAPTVTVLISSTLNSYSSEKRFNRGLTLAELKCKLELVVGTPASCMDLELFGLDSQLLARLDSDEALLGSYPVDDGCRIHVIDKSGSRIGEYEDVSRVEKYELSNDAYDQRSDSVRSFLKRNKMGQFKDDDLGKTDFEQKLGMEKALAEAIAVGARCEARVAGQPPKLGVVMYSGLVDFKPGYWVGVKYDEPLGKNDGTVDGKQYFQCPPKYGAFVKPQFVTVGDFPEEDYGLDDEM